jgi:hypothetical protein
MRKDVAILAGALVVSNAVWAAVTLGRVRTVPETAPTPVGRGHVDGTAGTSPPPATENAPSGGAAPTERRDPVLARPAARDGATPSTPAPDRASEGSRPGRPTASDLQRAREAIAGAKADVLQIADPARRERGLDAIEAALRSRDPATVTTALQSLYDLRDVAYDKRRFRDAVLDRLGDSSPIVRGAAASALLHVAREPDDAARVLAMEAEFRDPGHPGLIVAAWIEKNRVEGAVADAYVRALSTNDAREAIDVANQLRNMTVTAEVEDAVLAAWRKHHDTEPKGLWPYVLGQMRPTREARVRVLFEMLAVDDTSVPQLVDRAFQPGNLDEAAVPVAARLAIEALPTAPNALVRSLEISVLRHNGTRSELPALRAYAENDMVPEAARKEAAAAADEIERRGR